VAELLLGVFERGFGIVAAFALSWEIGMLSPNLESEVSRRGNGLPAAHLIKVFAVQCGDK
jgi:hypothetical protein